jgi:hypothetical protein
VKRLADRRAGLVVEKSDVVGNSLGHPAALDGRVRVLLDHVGQLMDQHGELIGPEHALRAALRYNGKRSKSPLSTNSIDWDLSASLHDMTVPSFTTGRITRRHYSRTRIPTGTGPIPSANARSIHRDTKTEISLPDDRRVDLLFESVRLRAPTQVKKHFGLMFGTVERAHGKTLRSYRGVGN